MIEHAQMRLCRPAPNIALLAPVGPLSPKPNNPTLAEKAPSNRNPYEVSLMQTDTPDRILRIKTVLERTGLSRSTMYRKTQNGTFPKACKSAPAAPDGASPPSMHGCAIRCSTASKVDQ